jgi:hypothetical protein
MIIISGITQDNPNETSSRYITVKLIPSNQIVKAVFINPIILDSREQKPNVKVGTEVLVAIQNDSECFILGSTQQGTDKETKKIYKLENSDEVQILTDKKLLISGIDGDIEESVINTKSLTLNNADKTILNTTQFNVKNSTAEYTSTLSDTIQAVTDLIVIGNLGVPATLDPSTISALQALKAKIDSFK